MVIGLDKFKEYFEEYPNNYVIIGGTACDIKIEEAGFIPRATDDIDIILANDLPDKDIFKKMGLGSANAEELFSRLLKNFNLKTK